MATAKRILFNYIIGWFIANLIWHMLWNGAQKSTNDSLIFQIGLFIITWLPQGIGYGLINIFVNKYINKRVSYKNLMTYSLLLQLTAASILLVVVFYLFTQLQIEDIPYSFPNFISMPVIPKALVYALVTNFTITLFNQVNGILGRGNLVKIASGQYYEPKESHRILMFLDLRGSTRIAEKLGHHRFSQLIQDCFYDLAIVDKYTATVYKYVGDEAILQWKPSEGKASMNCLKAFFAFEEKIKGRSEYYKSTYGLVPAFKAGMHIGNVIIAEVGEIKKEIAINGDTINTSARIEGECNRLEADFLISEDLLNFLDVEPWIISELKGEIQLKGKSSTMKIYAIQRS